MAPNHPEALHHLGLLLYRLNRFDSAVTMVSRAIDHAPSSPLYWLNLHDFEQIQYMSIVSSSAASIAPTSTRCNDSTTNWTASPILAIGFPSHHRNFHQSRPHSIGSSIAPRTRISLAAHSILP